MRRTIFALALVAVTLANPAAAPPVCSMTQLLPGGGALPHRDQDLVQGQAHRVRQAGGVLPAHRPLRRGRSRVHAAAGLQGHRVLVRRSCWRWC